MRRKTGEEEVWEKWSPAASRLLWMGGGLTGLTGGILAPAQRLSSPMAAARPGARGASPGRVLRERGGGGAAVKATGKVAEPTARTARRSTSALYCTSVCCAYAATSVIITFANKILLSTYGFKFEMTLILAQLLVGTVVMKMLFSFGLCAPPSVDARSLRKSVPLAFWFLIYVTSGLGSLRSLSVPTWAALRRLTALFILIFDYAFDGKTAPLRIWMSVCLMLVGGLVAAAGLCSPLVPNSATGSPTQYTLRQNCFRVWSRRHGGISMGSCTRDPQLCFLGALPASHYCPAFLCGRL